MIRNDSQRFIQSSLKSVFHLEKTSQWSTDSTGALREKTYAARRQPPLHRNKIQPRPSHSRLRRSGSRREIPIFRDRPYARGFRPDRFSGPPPILCMHLPVTRWPRRDFPMFIKSRSSGPCYTYNKCCCSYFAQEKSLFKKVHFFNRKSTC